ncbi:MAG: hypothetical protein IPP04_09590 [Saprospiraceae bacterium]|nr:hypothetical protein [Saprospiraceae bacterium]MBK9930111.1 hypothetical protein [Saprospiraceae bacterium]
MNLNHKSYRSLLYSLICIIATSVQLQAQSTTIPIGSDQEYWVDRMCMDHGTPPFFHRNIKPYSRKDIIDLLIFWESKKLLKPSDAPFVEYMKNDNNEWVWKLDQNLPPEASEKKYIDTTGTHYYLENGDSGSRSALHYTYSEKPILKYFYQSPAHLVEVNHKDFYLRVNPVLNVQAGRELNQSENILSNQRGVDFRMGIDDKIYIQSSILENQQSFPSFFRDKIEKHRSLPGAGFYKYLNTSSIYKPLGYDYFKANAQFGVQVSKHVHVQLGHGTNFIGDGMRSLFLSDYAQEYFFLKLNTRIWKLHYQNIFAELSASTQTNSVIGNELLPKKYMAAHTLQMQLLPRLNIGLFETVIFHRKDHFEFQYLNPVILYRSVEGSIGSPDNVMLGINSRWDIHHDLSIYGQLLIDEFVSKEAFNPKRGWWGNKFGGQLGIKYINALGIDHLDLQGEYNSVRPYTYSHFDSTANYTHQLTPLAHPLGANFKEWLLRARYAPTTRWQASAYLLASKQGDDPDPTKNFGGDLTKPYTTRASDYGNTTTQGELKSIYNLGLTLSYQVFHNYYLDLHTFYRKDIKHPEEVTKYIGGGLRVNFWRRDLVE